MINNINQLDLNKRYTYADYLTWEFKERVELFKGKIFKMSPAPSEYHQRVQNNLNFRIYDYFKDRASNVYSAPFDVRLPLPPSRQIDDGKINTVVQPDITVVCDLSKLDKRGCIGAPDLVVEVLSPGNSRKEMKEKFELYQHAGVKEYWLVEPANETIIIYTLNEKGIYVGSRPFTEDTPIISSVVKGIELTASQVF